jgi:hypothetical protein
MTAWFIVVVLYLLQSYKQLVVFGHMLGRGAGSEERKK